MKDILKGNKLIKLSVIVFALLLITSLYVFQYGVTDNGELTSRLVKLGLYDCQSASGSGEYATKFGVSGAGVLTSTADIPYIIAKLFHPVDSTVSVFVPAFIYCALILLGFYLLIKNLFGNYDWNNILLSVLCIFVFGDVAYTSFLNTPYINAVQLAYCIFSIGALVWMAKSGSIVSIIIAAVSACLFAGTSKATAWIGILLAVYFAILIFKYSEVSKKAIYILGTVVILLISIATLIFVPVEETKLYDSVFYGIALNESDQAVELGFDYETANLLSGKASFDENAQRFLDSVDLNSMTSDSKVALQYLKNPALLVKNLKQVAMNSTMISTDYLGNYRYASGKGFGQTKFFKLYSTFKRRLLPANLLISLLIILAVAAGAIYYRKKYSSDKASAAICYLIVIAALSALIAFVLPLIYGGLAQIGFNMFLYNLLFDVCLVSAIVGGTKLLWIRREALKEKYGVNQ